MMHDNLDPEATSRPEQATPRTEGQAEADREVPLDAAHTPDVIHAWLDGERVDEQTLRAAGGYELWRQVQAEADRRRRMRTPSPIAGAIIKAINKEG